MKDKNVTTIVLTVILTLSLLSNFYLYFLREPVTKEVKVEVVKKDTVTDVIRDYDTVYVEKTKYKDRYHYDTVHVADKVYVRDTIMNYAFNEKDYDLSVYAVKLDRYKLDIHARDTITFTKTEIKTVVKPKKNLIGLGVIGGYGYGFNSKSVEPFIGVGVTLNLFTK